MKPVVPNFICRHLQDGSVPPDDNASDSCLFIAMLHDLFSNDMPGQYSFGLIYAKNRQHVIALPTIHENWKLLAKSQREDMDEYRATLSEGFTGYRVFELCRTKWSVVVLDTMYANHVCDGCMNLYTYEINATRCKSSNHMSYSATDMARFWDSCSHDRRKEIVSEASFLLVLYVDDTTLPPEHLKLVSVIRGDVNLSGSTLLKCLDVVSEGTYLLRTPVRRPTLREPLLKNEGFVSLMGHELSMSMVQAFSDSMAQSLMEPEPSPPPAKMSRKKEKKGLKKRERFMKRLESMLFGSDVQICSSWADVEC